MPGSKGARAVCVCECECAATQSLCEELRPIFVVKIAVLQVIVELHTAATIHERVGDNVR